MENQLRDIYALSIFCYDNIQKYFNGCLYNESYPQLKEKSYVLWCISSQYLFIPFQPTNNRKHEVKFLCCKNSIIIILPQIGIINM